MAEAAKSPSMVAATSPKVLASQSPKIAATMSPKVEAAKSPKIAATSTPKVEAAKSPAVVAQGSPKVPPAKSPQQEAAKSPANSPAASPGVPEEEAPKVPENQKVKVAKVPKAKKSEAAETGAPLKSASASREDNLAYDLHHMAAYDIAPWRANTSEADFLTYTRDSVQLLVNHMFALSKKRIEEGMVVELPAEEAFRLPRQKPCPKVLPATRWTKFMEDRNMTKRKRSRLVFDEVSGDWKPRWGYLSVKKGKEDGKMGIYEVKTGEDPNSNPFERMQAEKKLVMMRQKMREVRNKVEAAGGKMRASIPDLSKDGQKRGKDGLKEALKRAQVSSGSRGKFDRTAANEATNLQPKRQKIPETMSGDKERDRYMKFAGKVLSGETVDKDKAAKAGRQAAEGTKVPRQVKAKGNKGTPGSQRRSKQGGANKKMGGNRTRGRKVKA